MAGTGGLAQPVGSSKRAVHAAAQAVGVDAERVAQALEREGCFAVAALDPGQLTATAALARTVTPAQQQAPEAVLQHGEAEPELAGERLPAQRDRHPAATRLTRGLSATATKAVHAPTPPRSIDLPTPGGPPGRSSMVPSIVFRSGPQKVQRGSAGIIAHVIRLRREIRMDGGDGYAAEERQRGSSSMPSPAESAVPISTGSTWNTPKCMSSSVRQQHRMTTNVRQNAAAPASAAARPLANGAPRRNATRSHAQGTATSIAVPTRSSTPNLRKTSSVQPQWIGCRSSSRTTMASVAMMVRTTARSCR